MAVIENKDLGMYVVGSAGGTGHEHDAAESPPDSHSDNESAGAAGEQGLSDVPPPPPPPPQQQQQQQQQQQRSLSIARAPEPNLPQPGFPVVGLRFAPDVLHAKVRQHTFHPFGHGLTNGVQGVPGGGVMAAAQRSNGAAVGRNGEVSGEGFRRDMRELEELLSKLNPMAEEFVPSSVSNNSGSNGNGGAGGSMYSGNFATQNHNADNGNSTVNGNVGRRRRNNFSQGKRRTNSRTSMAQREEIIRRTVYVSDIDHQVTEEQLAALFVNCGQVVDCRICGDPNSVLRFAFIEFTDEEGARAALSLSGTMLGYYPVRVLPSKTAIAPVNPTFLPRSEDEREMCSRTVYCTNIDKSVSQTDVKVFFEAICGEVYRLRLLGDYHHSTRIAFVEFVMAESAIAALNCSGVVLGSLPIRVSPSKTPVRPRAPRPSVH